MPINRERLLAFHNKEKAKKQEFEAGYSYFQMKEPGKYEVRIIDMLPQQSAQHWGILSGKDGKFGGGVRCPKVYDGSDCPVCEYVESLKIRNDKESENEIKEIRAKFKYPMTVLWIGDDSESPKPRIFEAPHQVFEPLMEYLENPKYVDLLDYQRGRNITILRTGRGRDTKYSIQVDPDKSSVDIDVDSLPDLRTALKPPSYEQIQYALENGTWPEKDESPRTPEPQRPKPTPAVNPPTSAKKFRAVPKETEQEDVPDHVPVEHEEEKETSLPDKPTSYVKGLPATKVDTKEERQSDSPSAEVSGADKIRARIEEMRKKKAK